MTEAEIMKALECCASKIQMCKDCSMPKEIQDDCKCMETLSENVLDLIDWKNAEIKRLTNLDKLHDKITADSIAEAIKEFSEKAKDTKFKIGNEYVIYADNIDQIAKEMGVEL